MNPRIVLAGYYGFGNAGDELILKTILGEIQASGKNPQISVLSRCSPAAQDHRTDVNRWSPWAVLKAIFQCDVLVLGGGGLLQDKTGALSLWYYLSLLWAAFLFRKKTVLLAQGLGPIACSFHWFLVRHTVQRVDWITVRDEASLKRLQNPRARLSADPLFLIKTIPSSPSQKLVLVPGPSGTPEFWNELGKSVLAFSRKHGLEIVLFPFHPARDQTALHALEGMLGIKAKTVMPGSQEELLGILSQAEAVVSMRLHGLILSALLERPALGISTDPKLDNFIGEFSFAAGITPLLSMEEASSGLLEEKLEIFWQNRNALVENVRKKLPGLKSRARAGFEWLAGL